MDGRRKQPDPARWARVDIVGRFCCKIWKACFAENRGRRRPCSAHRRQSSSAPTGATASSRGPGEAAAPGHRIAHPLQAPTGRQNEMANPLAARLHRRGLGRPGAFGRGCTSSKDSAAPLGLGGWGIVSGGSATLHPRLLAVAPVGASQGRMTMCFRMRNLGQQAIEILPRSSRHFTYILDPHPGTLSGVDLPAAFCYPTARSNRSNQT